MKKAIQKKLIENGITIELMDKIIATIAYLPIPVLALGEIWGFDISAYIDAGCAVVISICAFIKVFLKK